MGNSITLTSYYSSQVLNSHPRSARPLAGFGRIMGPDGGELWSHVRTLGISPEIPVTNSGWYTMCLSAR